MSKFFSVKYRGKHDYEQARSWIVRARNAIEAKALVYASLAEYRVGEYSQDGSDWDVEHIPVQGESVILHTYVTSA